MTDQISVKTNADGTATATVGGRTKTFPDLYLAVEWAEGQRYELDGENDGN